MKALRIGPSLTLPRELVTSTLVAYGGKGMGKTNLAAVIAEELAAAGLRWSWLDPLGVAWGIRHSADGKGPGVECLILGGPKGDVPIAPSGGAEVADVVIEESVNVLIDFSRKPSGEMWGVGEKIKFVTDYAHRLFQRQGDLLAGGRRREPLFQILDEAARYIPQNMPAGNPQIALSVSAWQQLVEEGRNIGLGVGLITQRSARMNKDVSELADVLFAFRTVGPNSHRAVMDWLGEHVEKARLKDLGEQVRQLSIGQALVVSPGWLRYEGVEATRLRSTFDSSATPKAGERAKTARGAGARPDIAKIRARMAVTIERAKSDDPKELRRLLAEKEKQVRQLLAMKSELRVVATEGKVKEVVKRVEIPMLKEGHVVRIEKSMAAAQSMWERANAVLAETSGLLRKATAQRVEHTHHSVAVDNQPAALPRGPAAARPFVPLPDSHAEKRKSERPLAPSGDEWTAQDQRTLDTLAMLVQRGIPANRECVARWQGIHPNGSRFLRSLAALRAGGYIEGFTLTPKGEAQAAPRPTTGLEAAYAALPDEATRKILMTVVALDRPVTRAQVADSLGIHPNGSRFLRGLAWLRTMGVITDRGPISATEGLTR